MLRSNYTFSEYSTEELREEARRHERFEEWSREELEEDYEQLENTEANAEKYKNIKWILIAVLCAFLGYYYGSMNTKLHIFFPWRKPGAFPFYKNKFKKKRNFV